MAKINLLPWREELRKQRKQDFFTAIGISAGVAVAILISIHFYIDGLQSYQQSRNSLLQAEIARLDKKIAEIKSIEEKKSKMLAKIDLIYKLQKSRPEVVHLFEEIPNATPDGVFLTKLTQTGDEIVFEGRTQSNARVSAFMRAVENSKWLQSPVLNLIRLGEGEDDKKISESSTFVLKVKHGEKETVSEPKKKGGQ